MTGSLSGKFLTCGGLSTRLLRRLEVRQRRKAAPTVFQLGRAGSSLPSIAIIFGGRTE